MQKNYKPYLHAMKSFIRNRVCAFLWPGMFLLAGISGYAQIPVGGWRDHLPYDKGYRLAEYGNKIFCLTSDGSLFSYNTKDKSLQKYSKVTGLSDSDISAIGYSSVTGTFIIGYSNGNIDLLRNDSIINLPDIKRKTITGEKSINNIYFKDNYAYLACGFGIVLCDLTRKEIKDSYFFGNGGTQIYVHDIASDGEYLYAATDEGIYKASLSSPNLVDFNAWEKISGLPDPDKEYRFIACYNNKLFTVYSNSGTGFDDIITFNNTGWQVWDKSYSDKFDYLGSQNGNLLFASQGKIKVYGDQEILLKEYDSYFGKYVLLDSDKVLWYANPVSGLARCNPNGGETDFYLQGPAYRDVGDIEILSGKLWAGGGTEASKWTGYGAYSFINEKWQAYNQNTIPALKGFLNISEISIDPLDPDHVVGGSYGYGVVEFQDGVLTDIQDETDGVFLPVDGYGHEYVRVCGTSFDSEGNLYVSCSDSKQAAYRKMKEKSWEKVPLDSDPFESDKQVGEIMADASDRMWLLLQDLASVVVFKEDDEGNLEERTFAVNNEESSSFSKVYSIATDKDGDIWVGTNKGPVVYYGSTDFFSAETITGNQPKIPRNDNTNYVDLLLTNDKINDIAVDGANRKWLATEKSGVFLVSADGIKEIHHFTESNSPLFSNNVLTVAVNDKTGEVFFGTEKGIISYRDAATEGGDDFGKVYVFPNPVRENYEGEITITGLVADANVKITDISGNLLYETTSLGGQAVWDGKNFRGQRVQTGIYLVFCATKDGSKTHVTKLLFIH
jgi:hypothetical protein